MSRGLPTATLNEGMSSVKDITTTYLLLVKLSNSLTDLKVCPYFLTRVLTLLIAETTQLKYKHMCYSSWGWTYCRGRRNSATALYEQ